MLRKIIKIDEEKCTGCGICVEACHEGAIGMIDGKAKLLRDDYCDGLGDCLPACPENAISFEEREAAAYDEAAVLANMAAKEPLACGCPGSAVKQFMPPVDEAATANQALIEPPSQLSQWPTQIKLVPINAPFFNGVDLLIAADCAAYAYAGFHERFMKGHVTIIGCPKLDQVDYSEKLTAIFSQNDIKSITVARMEVPCCGGIENAAKIALANSNKEIPLKIVTLSTSGKILR